MYRYELPIILCIFCIGSALVTTQSHVDRCYKFTWLGLRYTNEFLNSTCAEATQLASGVPCQMPLNASSAALVTAQSQVARCYKFTWLGPRYTNESEFLNSTCADATQLASGVPCQMPLVASFDGSWPDVQYIWRYHQDQASCVLANNDICAQYTYYFNGDVENSTYMCTRAVNADGVALTSGCYQQKNGSFITRVCLCRSVPGGLPCNGARNSYSNMFFIFVAFLSVRYFFIGK